MSVMNKAENVKEQYSDDKNLSIRIKLHAKYSTNKLGMTSWLFEKYKFCEGFRILELGCGNANQWDGNIDKLPPNCTVVLTDFSTGMVDTVRRKLSNYSNVFTQQVDIQNIPFPNESFDVVIANHMLYHIPDLNKALSEVNRVLKTNGSFYATTNGTGGMRPYLHNALKSINPKLNTFNNDYSFNLQNGEEILHRYFKQVKRYDYKDSLAITETQDLIDWIKSTITISNYAESDLNGLFEYFETIRKKDGAIKIPKESGLFISRK